ncbi:MAG: chalcone isomerase family protein [Burkholderiales bacterium]
MKLAILAVLSLAFSLASAAEIAGVKLAESESLAPGGAPLVLNGAGLRKRAFFQVYAIGLYLAEKKTAGREAIGAAGPKRVAIHMLRDVDAATFTEALVDGMRGNHDEAAMKAFEPRIAQLSAIMAEMKEAKKGMRITLDWVPAAGTQLGVEGKPAGKPIAGEDFYRALLSIWLGERPVQDDLKKALLGEKQ